jgi:hypothetical protein
MVAVGGCSAATGPLARERAHRGVSTLLSSGSASVQFAPAGSSFRPVAALSFRTAAIAPAVREDPGRSFNFFSALSVSSVGRSLGLGLGILPIRKSLLFAFSFPGLDLHARPLALIALLYFLGSLGCRSVGGSFSI